MRINKFAVVIGFAIATVLFLEVAAHADEQNQFTTFTFNKPVEIPGQILPAGTYLFKLADPDDMNLGFFSPRFLPPWFSASGTPVANLPAPADVSAEARRHQLDLLQGLNAAHQRRYPNSSELDARIRDYERAARMQLSVPEALDLAKETAEAGD